MTSSDAGRNITCLSCGAELWFSMLKRFSMEDIHMGCGERLDGLMAWTDPDRTVRYLGYEESHARRTLAAAVIKDRDGIALPDEWQPQAVVNLLDKTMDDLRDLVLKAAEELEASPRFHAWDTEGRLLFTDSGTPVWSSSLGPVYHYPGAADE